MSLFPCWDCGHAHQLHLTLHEFWGLDLNFRVYVATFYTRSHLSDPPNCINTAVTEPLATFFFFFKGSSRCCNGCSSFHTRRGTKSRELQASPHLPSDVIVKWFFPLKSVDILFNFSLFTKLHSFLSYQMVDLVSKKAALVFAAVVAGVRGV